MHQQTVAIRVYAKINLFLRILGKRSDGYHEIDSLLHPVQVGDEIEVRPSSNGFSVECDSPEFPAGTENTVYKSYSLLRSRFPEKVGSCRVVLRKNIPTRAGMGGASADAAGALLAFDRFFDLSLEAGELNEIGASVGSDVPFFLYGGPAVCRGRGEVVQPIEGHLSGPVALAISTDGVSTGSAYSRFLPDSSEDQLSSDAVAIAVVHGDLEGASGLLYNTFERLIYPIRPDLEANRRTFLDCGARGALMTGSGATVFAIGMNEGNMECARKQFDSTGRKAVFTALRQNTYEWLCERCPDPRSDPA